MHGQQNVKKKKKRQYVAIYLTGLKKAMELKISPYLSPYLKLVRQKYLESSET